MRAFAVLFALALAAPALAVPMQLSHQGRLADAGGAPLEGVHTLTVSVYAEATGGDALWTGAVEATLEGGHFAIVLGADPSNPLPAELFDGSIRYVGLSVGSEPELAGRLPLTSVPYAVRAGSARDLSGGVVDASEIRVNGVTVIDGDGALATSVSWDDLTDVPDDADTLGELGCASGEIAVYDGVAWGCGSAAPSVIDVATLNGTIAITNLPVGSGASEVAAGDHTHGFGQITGQAAASQLPVGTGADQVAAGDHTHSLADLGGDLPFSRISGTAAIGQLPTGTSGTTVALGNHTHAFSAITGTAAIGQLPTGTTGTTVALGNHTHDAGALTSGTIAIARLPQAAITAAAIAAQAGSPDPTWPVSCKAIKDNNSGATSGYYTIDPDGAGAVSPYTVYCEQSLEGGGWTRILSLDEDANYTSLDGVPNSQEYVNNGTFHFSKTQLKASNREVLIVEEGSPSRMHRYDFKQGTNPQGEDFVGTITGDRAATVAVWNWSTNSWVSGGNGQCNTNNHSQWNCTPPSGVRFHYATRNWQNDGGSSVPAGWGWFTGYVNGYGNLNQLVRNWDNQQNKTAHHMYVR